MEDRTTGVGATTVCRAPESVYPSGRVHLRHVRTGGEFVLLSELYLRLLTTCLVGRIEPTRAGYSRRAVTGEAHCKYGELDWTLITLVDG